MKEYEEISGYYEEISPSMMTLGLEKIMKKYAPLYMSLGT